MKKRTYVRVLLAGVLAATQLFGMGFAAAPRAAALQPQTYTADEGQSTERDPANGNALYPIFKEEYRSFYQPDASITSYLNDHALIQNRATGAWNLIGIATNQEPSPANEKYFAHGVGASLAGSLQDCEADGGKCLDSTGIMENGTPNPVRHPNDICWAPHIIYHDDLYYMYYAYRLNSATTPKVESVQFIGHEMLYTDVNQKNREGNQYGSSGGDYICRLSGTVQDRGAVPGLFIPAAVSERV